MNWEIGARFLTGILLLVAAVFVPSWLNSSYTAAAAYAFYCAWWKWKTR